MGQQQVLLIILTTIIVGISTIVAINIFTIASQNKNKDAVINDLILGATNAQQIWERPTFMGGINKNFQDNEELIIQAIGIPGIREGTTITNDNGTYTISPQAEDILDIQGLTSMSGEAIILTVFRTNDGRWDIEFKEDE